MYSNFITPPDFVEDDLHTVTIVDATVEDVELMARMCETSDEMYNIYLYRAEMDNLTWLQEAITKSSAIIVNSENKDNHWLCDNEKTFYYGSAQLLAPVRNIESPLQYFALRQQK